MTLAFEGSPETGRKIAPHAKPVLLNLVAEVMARLADRLKAAPVLPTDGGIETRLIYEFPRSLPDFASEKIEGPDRFRPGP
jgi:hypothetical protein